jgi:PAS domain S-box-containing protein
LKHTDLSAEPDQTRQATAEAQPRVPLRYHRTQDGTVFPVEITARHLRWAGRPAHLAAIRDITARVQAEAVLAAHTRQLEAEMTARTQSEARLARSEAWLRLAQASAGAGTWEWDLQTNENRWSDELWSLYGLAPHSRPPSYEAWRQTVHPDDRARAEAAVQAAAQQGSELTAEWRVATADGTERWLLSRGRPLRNAAGQVERYLGIVLDITARKQVEAALRHSADQHRAILQTAMDGFWVVDTQGRLRDVNATYCRMSGYSEEELLALRIPDLEAAETAAATATRIQKILAQGEDRFESRHRRKDGSLFDVEVSVQSQASDGGRLVVFVRDITARKSAEDVQGFLARTSSGVADEPFFHTLARYLAQSLGMDFVCIDRLEGDGLTARTVAVWCDGQFEDNVTYALQDTPCGEVVGKTACCFPASVCQYFPRDQVLQDLRAESYVGVTLWSHAGQPIGLIAVIGRRPLVNRQAAETTLQLVGVRAAGELERLEAEVALRRAKTQSDALNRINELVHATLDLDQILQRLVVEGAAALGSETAAVTLREGDGWIIRHVHRLPAHLVGLRLTDAEERAAVLALATGQPVAVADTRTDERVDRDHLRPHHGRAVLVAPLHAHGAPLGALSFSYHTGPHAFTDTEVAFARQLAATASIALENALLFQERQLAARTLQELNEELEQRVQERTAELAEQARQLQVLTGELTLAEQRERQRLAHVLHDDLQQLLVAAKLRVTFLARTDRARVADGCRELTDLLEEVLTACRTLTGELSPPILQTGGLVAGLEWLVRWQAEKFQLAVALDADPLAVPDSEAMTLLLFQSVRELLFNVVKHAQVLAARVEVRQQDGHLQIVVSDQGVGFDSATLRATGGGGLGLSSIRQRLKYLGGYVGIVTAPGQGCRITLAAPFQSQASVPPATAAEPAPGRSARRPGRGERIRVLLVDDHAVVRQALAQLLQQEPDLIVVGVAADGKAGVNLTQVLQPDVVLMDINMPVLNGMEATQQIHAVCPGVRVIGLSMFETAEQTAAMRSAGIVAYVSKTAPAEELLAAIRTTMGASVPSQLIL